MTPDRDHEPRVACFLALDALRAQFGPDLPLAGGLRDGFVCGGKRIPFLAPPRGIFKAAEQSGSAALSVLTSVNSPYDDEETDEGFWYAYRRGADDLADNRALRAAWADGVPLAYFVGIRPGWYQALYPVWAIERDDVMRRVLLSPSPGGAADLRPPDAGERRYATREARVRLHRAASGGWCCRRTGSVSPRASSGSARADRTRPGATGTPVPVAHPDRLVTLLARRPIASAARREGVAPDSGRRARVFTTERPRVARTEGPTIGSSASRRPPIGEGP